MKPRNNSLTLIELLVSVCILAFLAVGFISIEIFSYHNVMSADRLRSLQNEASYVLEHMAKNLCAPRGRGGPIGDASNYPVQAATIDGNTGIRVRMDSDSSGKLDAPDVEIAYTYSLADHQIWYYPDYTTFPSAHEAITFKKIRSDFSTDLSKPTYCSYYSDKNYIEVQIGACWNPASDTNCGSTNNPAVSIRNRIYMPSVSTH